MVFFASLFIDGALAGTVYALFALAFVVVYKATRMINFALGEWAMVGSRLVATAHALGVGPVGSLALGGTGTTMVTALVNRVVLRPLVGRPLISLIMVTIGLGAMMRGAGALVFAGIPAGIALPIPLEALVVLGVPVSTGKLTAALVAGACVAATGWFFAATRTGLALRAVADDQQVAGSVGIDVDRHFALVWILMALLSGGAGLLWSVAAAGGFGVALLGLKVFPIVILGGLDSVAGTIVAAIVIGVLESLSAGYLDPALGAGFGNIAPYIVLLAVLFVRPYGLFGRPDVERV